MKKRLGRYPGPPCSPASELLACQLVQRRRCYWCLAGIEQLRKLLIYWLYFQFRFSLLTNLLVQLLLAIYKLCGAMRCRRE
jgi:hypothetical protein